jgi:hypothetical protein
MAKDIPNVDFIWQQGTDASIDLDYKQGDPAVGVDLTDYQVKMTINSLDGMRTYTADDAILSADGHIKIIIPRTLTIDAGVFKNSVGQVLRYDIILRNAAGLQNKILRGVIYYEPTETLWT